MNKYQWIIDLVRKHEIKCTPKQFIEAVETYELADNGYLYISGFDAINIAHLNGRPVSDGLENGYYRLINDGKRSALIDLREYVNEKGTIK